MTKTEINVPFALIARQSDGSGAVTNGWPFGAIPELLCEKKHLLIN